MNADGAAEIILVTITVEHNDDHIYRIPQSIF